MPLPSVDQSAAGLRAGAGGIALDFPRGWFRFTERKGARGCPASSQNAAALGSGHDARAQSSELFRQRGTSLSVSGAPPDNEQRVAPAASGPPPRSASSTREAPAIWAQFQRPIRSSRRGTSARASSSRSFAPVPNRAKARGPGKTCRLGWRRGSQAVARNDPRETDRLGGRVGPHQSALAASWRALSRR